MKSKTFVIALLATASFASAHFDVRPYVVSGQIVTGGHDDAAGIEEPVVRVFGYDFGEDPTDPFFAQDPGFNARAGSGLPGGSQLGFNLISSLIYWDGTGTPILTNATDQSMTFSFGANTRTVGGNSAPQSGFSLQTVGADGSVHRHLNAFLNGADGNALPASIDGIEAPVGVYALAMALTSSDPTITASEPFYLVFNNGLSEQLHDDAIDFVANTYIPEPTTMLPTLLMLRRGRLMRE